MRKQPNILLIMSDQFRQDALSIMGDPGCGTPALDRLARDGMLYTGCVTTSPICAPARASMLLGRFPSEIGVLDNSPHIVPCDKPNWVRSLREHGYRTSVFGKTHYYTYNGTYPDMRDMEGYLCKLGYDTADELPGPRVCGRIMSHMTSIWKDRGLLDAYQQDMASRYGRNQAIVRPSIVPFGLYPDVYPARKACQYIEDCDPEQPFFMFLSFPGPHDPWDCPSAYRDKYPSCGIRAPLGPMHDAAGRPRGIFDEEPEYDVPADDDIARIRMDYSAHVRLIDDMIQSVIDILQLKGLFDDTVIIFTSDHGEMLGDFGKLYKGNFMRSAVSIPLIISGRGISRGLDDRPCMLLDVGRTILDIAGIMDYGDEGISLLGSGRHDLVFSEYKDECMVSDGRWKLAVNRDDEPYLLFDHAKDPYESENLAGMGLDEEKSLRAKIIWHRRKIS